MPIENVTALFRRKLDEAKKRELTYAEKLEETKNGIDIFKYLLLIDTAALEGYVLQTKIQAEQSFRLSKYVAVIGFMIIATGIGYSIIGQNNLSAAYIAALAGVMTEFISGIFFYLYNKTLQQINIFHDKLSASRQISIGFLAECLKNKENNPSNENE